MSPSSTTVSTTSSMSDTSSYRPVSSSEYRRSEYHDGKVLRIHESRRRQHVTGTGLALRSKPVGAYTNMLQTDESSLEPFRIQSSDSSKPREQMSPKHVTASAHGSSKAKAVIFQTPIPLRPSRKTMAPAFETSGMPTPPPAPKIGRLSTPEFEDLEGTQFCDCCVDVHFVKYCASCGYGPHRF